MPRLRVAASAVELKCDDKMVICGSILPHYASAQAGKLRAAATVIEADTRLCLVSCDVIGVSKDLADEAATRISAKCGIPFENVLIAGTHTHHAPSTFRVHGYGREEGFCRDLVDAIAAAAEQAATALAEGGNAPNTYESEMRFVLTQEATVGCNSRILLKDGAVRWTGHPDEDHVRPTGPFDPDLPVVAFRDPAGGLQSLLFNHSTHNIGPCGVGRSPGVYGMAGQEIEQARGGVALFLPGAFGSTHNLHVPDVEAKLRIRSAVEQALEQPGAPLRGQVQSLKREFDYKVRSFDEAAEDAAVCYYCKRNMPPDRAESYIGVFRKQRDGLRPLQGEDRRTWLHVVGLGEVVFVGVPGEMFASLGMAIRRGSPFRHTFVVGLANDEVGYIPDEQGYALGGYQVWTGLHSLLPRGTGERMVQAALGMLSELHCPDAAAAPSRADAAIRPLRPDDALRVQVFYNNLSADARRLFRPMGWTASLDDCVRAVQDAEAGLRYDLALESAGRIVGWAFLQRMDQPRAHLGIGVADEFAGRGYGRKLMDGLVAEARRRGKEGIGLVAVQSNERALGLYRRFGFKVEGEHSGPDGQSYFRMDLDLRK